MGMVLLTVYLVISSGKLFKNYISSCLFAVSLGSHDAICFLSFLFLNTSLPIIKKFIF